MLARASDAGEVEQDGVFDVPPGFDVVEEGGASDVDAGEAAEEADDDGVAPCVPADESCNGADDDCDGGTDEGCPGGSLICSAGGFCWLNPLPQGRPLYDVWSAGPSDAWAVGEAGLALHWDGTEWSVADSTTDHLLGSVWGVGPSEVWAVGPYGGVILGWDGALWSTFDSVPWAGIADLWAGAGRPVAAESAPALTSGFFYRPSRRRRPRGLGCRRDDVWFRHGGVFHWDGVDRVGRAGSHERTASRDRGPTTSRSRDRVPFEFVGRDPRPDPDVLHDVRRELTSRGLLTRRAYRTMDGAMWTNLRGPPRCSRAAARPARRTERQHDAWAEIAATSCTDGGAVPSVVCRHHDDVVDFGAPPDDVRRDEMEWTIRWDGTTSFSRTRFLTRCGCVWVPD